VNADKLAESTPAEVAARLERIRSIMLDRDIDVVTLAPTDSLRYVLGFSPFPDERTCVLFLSARTSAFVVPSINAEDVRRVAEGHALFEWHDTTGPTSALTAAISHLRLDRASRVAVDPEMRADALLAIQSLLGDAEFVDGALVLRPAREVKVEGEVALLRASAAAADTAMGHALSACRPGVTEQEVAEAAVAGFREAGVTQVSFAIIGSGPNGAFPHHHTGDRSLTEGDAVVIDLGGRLSDYSSDITRMAYLGEPSGRYREVHEVVESAVVAAMAVAQPGAACGEIDAAARKTIASAGYGDYFVHRTGHGLGLSMHEPPWIVAGSQDPVREGMVFSIEPGIYLPGEFGVRLEEIVCVTSHGCEILSALPRHVHLNSAA
jgi:Xaa-Pro aminopeptidase